TPSAIQKLLIGASVCTAESGNTVISDPGSAIDVNSLSLILVLQRGRSSLGLLLMAPTWIVPTFGASLHLRATCPARPHLKQTIDLRLRQSSMTWPGSLQ